MYGLTRIALHNSYFTGLSVMFETDGHSNASGGNGAGKTSALNLIPIFYGTEPSQLVDQVAEKDSFIDFYLPKQSSALIYEHRREDGYRLVVMYRNSSGSKTLYRFIHGSLEETFFHPTIAPLAEQGAAITDIIHALQDMGIRTSKQIDTITDYRAIIQNDRHLLRRKGRNNSSDISLAREYCLGGPNDTMSHLDRMSFAILRRKDMFDRLKTMVAETQFNDLHIDDRPEHLKDKTLIDDIEGLRDFNAAEPQIRGCIEHHQQRKLIISDRNKTAAHLKTRCIEAMEQAEELDRLCAETDADITALKKAYTEETSQLREIHAGLKSEVRQLQIDLRIIHDSHQKWQDWDVSGKQALFANLDFHIKRQHLLAADHAMLTEKVSNLEQARKEKESQATAARDKALKERSDKKLGLADNEKGVIREHAQLREELAKREQIELDNINTGELAQERVDLSESLIKAKHNAQNIFISEKDQAALDAIEQQGEELSNQLELADQAKEACESDLKAHSEKHKTALETHQQAVRAFNRVQEKHDQIRELVYPSDNSLLSELRALDPGWAETVGKVIHPDLLKRSDLLPEFNVGMDETFYGWSLALGKIDIPDYAANEDVLHAQFKESESRLRVANQLCADREREAEDLFKAISPLEAKVIHAKHNHQQLLNQAKALRERYKSEKAEAQKRSKLKQAEARERTNQLKEALEALDKQIIQRKEAIKSSLNLERLDVDAREQSAIQEINTQLAQINADIDQIHSDYKQRVETITQRFSEDCEKEGVDPGKIKEAREATEKQQKKVESIQNYLPKLQQHELWMKTQWARVPKMEKELQDKTTQRDDANTNISIHNRKHTKQIKELESNLAEKRLALSKLNKLTEDANSLLSRCPIIESANEPTSTLEDLSDTLSRLLEEDFRLKKVIIKGVEKAQVILSKYINSRIYKAWEALLDQRRQLSHADEYDEGFRLQQPEDLSHLLDEDLPAIRDILIQQVRAVGDSLSKYHDCLKGLNDEVSRVSRHLGQKVNTNQLIENLTNIELQVTSVVVEGDYWDKLSSFNRQWKEWQEGRDISLPPEALLHAIKSANEALKTAKIANDIDSLIRLRISLEENGRKATVNNAREFDALSSNGLSYLAILVIFIGMARYLCPNKQIALHWPIDELAALSPENVARIFRMLDDAGLYCFSAFPSTDQNLLKFFKHRKLIDRKQGIRKLAERPKTGPNPLKDKLNELVAAEEI